MSGLRHPGLYVDVDGEGHRYCICGRGQAGHRRGWVIWRWWKRTA